MKQTIRLDEHDLRLLINDVVKHVINENRESKMRSLARRYAKSRGYSDEQCKEIDMRILHDIPNVRLGDYKFMLGVTRLFVDGQLSDAQSIMKINQYLKLLTATAHINEYDNDLNGMSFSEIDDRFGVIQRQFNQEDMQKSNERQFVENAEYQIVKIPDANVASKYANYTDWCVTHDSGAYDNYTGGGLGLFYFCLKNGFENVPKEKGENCPFDEYGLSMIAVSVNMDGSPNTITCRWNHENGANDHVMEPEELERVIGRGFYRTFKPYTREELHAKGVILFDEVQGLLNSGGDPYDIFDWISDFNEGFARVELNGKWNFINTELQLISDRWYDWIYYFYDGSAKVKLNGKWNFISTEGRLVSDRWYDDVYDFSDVFQEVELNGRYNLINRERRLISNQWYDWIGDFDEGFARVELDGKKNLINTEGRLVSEQWYDDVWPFTEGFARVKVNEKWNSINTKGQLISNQWYDWVGYFNNGFALVKLDRKGYYIDAKGNLYDYNTRKPIHTPNGDMDYVTECVRRVINGCLK